MCAITTKSMDALDICCKTRDTRYRDKRSCHQGMWSAQHLWFPASDIRKKKKCYSRGNAFARCQAKTTLKSYWHELRDNQKYSKKIAMKTGTHTQVPVPTARILIKVIIHSWVKQRFRFSERLAPFILQVLDCKDNDFYRRYKIYGWKFGWSLDFHKIISIVM